MEDLYLGKRDLEPAVYVGDNDTDVRLEVEEIKDAVQEIVDDSVLAAKVESLRVTVEDVSGEIQSWRSGANHAYVEAIEILKVQVAETQEEWVSVSTTLNNQRERLETLLDSFPGIIETSTLKALSLRVNHLEQLVSEIIGETNNKITKKLSGRQMKLSLAALGVMTGFWILDSVALGRRRPIALLPPGFRW
jgi:hypothetical protein